MIWWCEWLCGWTALLLPHTHSGMSVIVTWAAAAAAVVVHVAVAGHHSVCYCIEMFLVFGWVYPVCQYNFQHWMSWLGWWWRVQQSVISMLNSRISWINRNLNAHCAFGVFLKACLFQRLISNINVLLWHSHTKPSHALRVRARMPLTRAIHSIVMRHVYAIDLSYVNMLLHVTSVCLWIECIVHSFETWT